MRREVFVLQREKLTPFEWVVHTSLQEEFLLRLAAIKSEACGHSFTKMDGDEFKSIRRPFNLWEEPCLFVQAEVCVSVLCALPPSASRRLLTATLSFPSETELVIDFGGDVQRYQRFFQGTSVQIWKDETLWRARLHVDVTKASQKHDCAKIFQEHVLHSTPVPCFAASRVPETAAMVGFLKVLEKPAKVLGCSSSNFSCCSIEEVHRFWTPVSQTGLKQCGACKLLLAFDRFLPENFWLFKDGF